MPRLTLALAALAAFTSIAQGAPTPQLFRVVDATPYWPNRLGVTSYTLTREGDRATLEVEARRIGEDDQHATTWSVTATESYAGTVRTVKSSTVLELVSDDTDVTYRCKTMAVAVAHAGAVRQMIRGGERVSNGRWRPGTTTTARALVCTRSLLDRHDERALYPPDVLVFASRGIEHVRADDNCCVRPGDSLRRIPADRSVARARD